MLTDTQLKAIELLAMGELTKAEIAKDLGVSARVIYKWQNAEEFKAELNKRSQQILDALEQEGKARMVAKGQLAIDNIVHLANTADSEKVKLDANIFIYESIFGKATAKLKDITERKENEKVDPDTLKNEFEQYKLKKAE